MIKQNNHRSAFTLVEMLVVILIIVILTATIVPLVAIYSKGSGVRDAARTLQAALAGARDRALASQRPRGLRLLVDENDPNSATTLVYVREQEPFTGTCHLVRARIKTVTPTFEFDTFPKPIGEQDETQDLASENSPVNLIVAGPGVDFSQFDRELGGPGEGTIRIDSAGAVFRFRYMNPTHLIIEQAPYSPVSIYRINVRADGSEFSSYAMTDYERLDRALNLAEGVPFVIPRSTVPVEDAEPILLPSGVVIDVGLRSQILVDSNDSTINYRSPETNPVGLSSLRMPDRVIRWINTEPAREIPFYEIMFGANGQLIGVQAAAARPTLLIWIRDKLSDVDNGATWTDPLGNVVARRGVKATSQASSHSIVTVHGRTGFVNSVPPFFTPDAGNPGYFDPTEYYREVSRGTDSGL